jgi:hypothetical protein
MPQGPRRVSSGKALVDVRSPRPGSAETDAQSDAHVQLSLVSKCCLSVVSFLPKLSVPNLFRYVPLYLGISAFASFAYHPSRLKPNIHKLAR